MASLKSSGKKRGTDIHMADDPVDNIIQPVETQMSRRRLGDTPKPNYIWLVTFTDIMGLMLTFFVLMFAMSEPQHEEWEQVKSALQTEIGKVYGATEMQGTEETIDLGKINYAQALDVRYLEELLGSVIESHEELKSITLIPQPGSVVLSMPQMLLFDPGQAEIKESGRKILYTLGGSLTRMRNRIEIDGHTDPRPLEGVEQSAFANNWELSLARAANVAAILEKVGYQQSVGISGFGSGRYQDLASTGDQTQQQDLARRVDIIIMNHAGKQDKIRALPRLP